MDPRYVQLDAVQIALSGDVETLAVRVALVGVDRLLVIRCEHFRLERLRRQLAGRVNAFETT